MSPKQVLVLEDERFVRDVLVDALSGAGYAVVGLEPGPKTMDRLSELTPDLILLDMMMPEMDGFEFMARLRANPAWAHIPLLIVSALGDTLFHDWRAARTLGVAGVLTKPVHLMNLRQNVERIIGPAVPAPSPEPPPQTDR